MTRSGQSDDAAGPLPFEPRTVTAAARGATHRPRRIFLASPNESRDHAELLATILTEGGHDVLAWWRQGVFPIGQPFLDALERAASSIDAAVVLFAEDDRSLSRGRLRAAPRDNLVFEYGMFLRELGRDRVAVAVLGSPRIPSDLDGITHLSLERASLRDAAGREHFVDRNRAKLLAWAQRIDSLPPHVAGHLRLRLPNAHAALSEYFEGGPGADMVQELDVRLAADVRRHATAANAGSWVMEHWLQDQFAGHIGTCHRIVAIDARGPAMWPGLAHVTYVQRQLLEHAQRNDGTLSAAVHRAVVAAEERALASGVPGTDRPARRWASGRPDFELVRILCWTAEEITPQTPNGSSSSTNRPRSRCCAGSSRSPTSYAS